MFFSVLFSSVVFCWVSCVHCLLFCHFSLSFSSFLLLLYVYSFSAVFYFVQQFTIYSPSCFFPFISSPAAFIFTFSVFFCCFQLSFGGGGKAVFEPDCQKLSNGKSRALFGWFRQRICNMLKGALWDVTTNHSWTHTRNLRQKMLMLGTRLCRFVVAGRCDDQQAGFPKFVWVCAILPWCPLFWLSMDFSNFRNPSFCRTVAIVFKSNKYKFRCFCGIRLIWRRADKDPRTVWRTLAKNLPKSLRNRRHRGETRFMSW